MVHPIEVSELVASVNGTEAMVAAALLHDVLEDTEVTVDLLEEQFGSKVADLVLWLTDISSPKDGNRSARKALDRQHSAAAPAAAQTIKVADLISNTRSIIAHDPGFAKVYLEEKRLLLDVLTRADPTLLTIAREQVG